MSASTAASAPNAALTAAWDMQKFWYNVPKAGDVKYGCDSHGA